MSRGAPVLVAVILSAAQGSALCAVQATTAPQTSPRAPSAALLPHDHWSRFALRRLAAVGLLEPARAWTAWPATHDQVLRLFRDAAAHADSAGPASTRLAASLESRLNAESATLPRSTIRLTATVGPVSGTRQNDLLAGNSVPSQTGYAYTGPRTRPSHTWAGGAASVHGSAGPVTAGIGVETGDGDALRVAYLAARIGPVLAWAGRRNLAFQSGAGDAIVLSGPTPLDGIGIDTPDGFRLPGFLRGIGTIRITQALARLDRSGPVTHPLFLAQRIAIAPSPAVLLGINRGAIFGGRGNLGVTPWRAFWLLLGQTDVPGKDSDFENQVVSLDAVVRPFDRKSIIFYLEWGFDDAGAAFLRVPAIVAGITAGGWTRMPAVQAGLEVVRFAGKCCGYPEWYRHGALPDGWTDGGVPIGHSLGGHGTELALVLDADLFSLPASVRSRWYLRDRGAENLYAPAWAGRSAGIALDASIAVSAAARVDVRAGLEGGSGGTRGGGRVAWLYAF